VVVNVPNRDGTLYRPLHAANQTWRCSSRAWAGHRAPRSSYRLDSGSCNTAPDSPSPLTIARTVPANCCPCLLKLYTHGQRHEQRTETHLRAPRTCCVAPSTMADHADMNKKDGHVPSPLQSLSSSTVSLGRSPPPALKMAGSPDPRSHRGSFAEQMRGTPSSPRASRQPSLTQSALQELLNNPPTKGGDVKFQNRDWKSIRLGEIVDSGLVRFAEYDTSVEDATNVSTRQGHHGWSTADVYRYCSRTARRMLSCYVRARTRDTRLAPLITATSTHTSYS
jgi:hypothetical protein